MEARTAILETRTEIVPPPITDTADQTSHAFPHILPANGTAALDLEAGLLPPASPTASSCSSSSTGTVPTIASTTSTSSNSTITSAHTKQQQHHHHVPRNPFLALGVQTSLAIALHKLPEGFIMYAANHANPKLGLSVFMSLSIHNICEGLAMALPLYLALQSRARAMLYASMLGGLSQPIGAAIAAFWLAQSQSGPGPGSHSGSGSLGSGVGAGPNSGLRQSHQEDESAAGSVALMYGMLFSVTSGIMASVGLQLYTEATSLNHSSAMCVRFALAGMCLLGLGQALMK
ncbi:hypothetical protein KEM52_002000 [Ascosphaera acerosa]|nr:hypothetical protein KEM52_002000 [Ascosphaera acerosa]